MQTTFAGIIATFAFDALLIAFLGWAFYNDGFKPRRISHRKGIAVKTSNRIKTSVTIGTLSTATIFGITYGLYDYMIAESNMAWYQIVGQSLLVLVVYDFAYYWLHRVMHHPKLLKAVHGVHHRARNPSAFESFYQHPVELFGGLFLYFGSILALGPVHPYAFVFTFFLFSTMNIVLHAGMTFPALGPLNYLIKKHQVHHEVDGFKNYASLTPLPDFVFRTIG